MTVNFAHCLFEQSGTFKKEFVRLGIPAMDYDIADDFGETDVVCDYFTKPTQFLFVNCTPAGKSSVQLDKAAKFVCNVSRVERSMISPDYARNFICDHILGIESGHSVPTLFDITNS